MATNRKDVSGNVAAGYAWGRLATVTNACLAAGDEEGAVRHYRQAIAADASPPPWVFAGLANVLLRQERLDDADQAFRSLATRHPQSVHGYIGQARVLQSRQAWQSALDAWEAVAARFPDLLQAFVGRAESLLNMGRFDEAETLLLQAGRAWSDAVSPVTCLARLATAKSEFSQARDRWRNAAERFPDDLFVRAGYVRSLLDVLDVPQSRAVFEAVPESSRNPAYQSVLADIHAASYDWPAALGVLRQVVESAPRDVNLRLKEAWNLRHVSCYIGEPIHVERAVSLCAALVDDFPHSLKARIALAECCVAASRHDDARRVIDGLPGGLETHRQAMELRAWKKCHDGDLAGAKQVWRAIEQCHYLPVVHRPLGSLEQLDGRAPRTSPGEVLLFTVLRNEAGRLPRFFDYYRRLGVDRFFVVDNDSDDGGTDFLLAQHDVHVFRTQDSYAKASSGMRWVNELVERFGNERWCLYVDVDEMLVFPGVENVGLEHLLRYMERKEHEVFCAFMLDMHGPTARHRPDCRPEDDLLPLYPFFDNTYHRAAAVRCPYRHVSGGILRLFRSTWNLSKTPIIRGGRSIRFLSSSHALTPAAVSDVTGVLLHFKMAGAADQWSLSGIGARNPRCVQRHLSYANELQALGQDLDFISESTVRYESSRQLVSLGLMQCPDDFGVEAPQPRGADGT